MPWIIKPLAVSVRDGCFSPPHFPPFLLPHSDKVFLWLVLNMGLVLVACFGQCIKLEKSFLLKFTCFNKILTYHLLKHFYQTVKVQENILMLRTWVSQMAVNWCGFWHFFLGSDVLYSTGVMKIVCICEQNWASSVCFVHLVLGMGFRKPVTVGVLLTSDC